MVQVAADNEIVPTQADKQGIAGPSKSTDVQDVSAGVLVVDTHSEATSAELAAEVWYTLNLMHNRKNYVLNLAESDRVFDLKAAIFSLTSVPPERQKLIGLVKGKLPTEDALIQELGLSSGKKFQLIGTPHGEELRDPSDVDLPDVFNDLDFDFSMNPEAARAFTNDRRNMRKIREATANLKQITLMEPLRHGKRLLVLDLDYTILDTKPLTTGALPPRECARPRLKEFLEMVYPHYDIAIWSQTSWIWLETKLVELELVGKPDNKFRINFVLDKTPMFTVFNTRPATSKESEAKVAHQVKALKIIWNILPQFGPKNTIHIDDLGRNFALNPREGLKIEPFKHAHTEEAKQDRELDRLAIYLVYIAGLADFRSANHKDWKKVVRALTSSSH